MKYNKNSTIGEILQDDSKNVGTLLGFGMHCLGCPFSRRETIERACKVHDLDLGFVLSKLNEQSVEEQLSSKQMNKTEGKNLGQSSVKEQQKEQVKGQLKGKTIKEKPKTKK